MSPDARTDSTADDLTRPEVSAAGHRGDTHIIDRALTHSDPAIRSLGLTSALRADVLDPDRLRPFLTDPVAHVRGRASELAARIVNAERLEADLRDRLGDESAVAEIAAFVLGEIGSRPDVALDPATIEAIETQVLHHDDALCRESAVAALGALHSGKATILVACKDKATVRRRAIIALAPFEGPDVDAALRTALEDRDWQVRQAAEDLLGPDEVNAANDPS